MLVRRGARACEAIRGSSEWPAEWDGKVTSWWREKEVRRSRNRVVGWEEGESRWMLVSPRIMIFEWRGWMRERRLEKSSRKSWKEEEGGR
jgi:hypothetical protein